MSTTVLDVRRPETLADTLARAAEVLRAGGLVAFPTETVYGLGANALDASAVARIFTAKERPNWDPIIVHVSDRAMLDQVAVVPPQAERLIAAFWPGPLTLLLPRTTSLPHNLPPRSNSSSPRPLQPPHQNTPKQTKKPPPPPPPPPATTPREPASFSSTPNQNSTTASFN